MICATKKKKKRRIGHVASKGVNQDLNPTLPNTNFCKLSTLPRIHVSALVDLEDLKFPVDP